MQEEVHLGLLGEAGVSLESNILKIEAGVLRRLPHLMEIANMRGKALVIADENVWRLYGAPVEEALDVFRKHRLEFIEDNTIAHAFSFAERVIATDVDWVLGFGGGRAVDVAKYAAYIAKRPFCSIPTTVANDGLASPIAVLKRKDGLPKSLGCNMPRCTFLDLDVVRSGPLELIRAGIGDTISNYTALADWELACGRGRDVMNDYAYLMSRDALDMLLSWPNNTIDDAFISILANSLVLSGIAMDFAGTSRPVSGSEHCFSHALDVYGSARNPHGIQVALGALSVLELTGRNASPLWEYLSRFDVKVNPKALGIAKDEFVWCFQHASEMRSGRYTCLDETDLSTGKLESLYDKLVKEL